MNKPPLSNDASAQNLTTVSSPPGEHSAMSPNDEPSFEGLNPVVSGVSSATTTSRLTAVSQDEIQKLISIHVHQELSKFPSLYDESDNADNINQHKFLKKMKKRLDTFASRFDSYFPFNYIIRFQNWYDERAKSSKILEVLGSAGYFSLLYPFVVAGIILGNVAEDKTVVVFVCNILAIIPLSVIISYLTETLAELTNPTVGGLLNITFGNAIELIFSILALFKGQLDTVQGSMVGSWLATTQLILGGAFFFASFNKKLLSFNRLTSYFNVIFMIFSGFVAKMVYSVNYNSNYTSLFKNSTSSHPSSTVVKLSTGFAVLHLLLYFVYLIIPYQHKKLIANAIHRKKKDLELNAFDNDMPSVVRFASTNRLEGNNDTISAFSDSNTCFTGISRSVNKLDEKASETNTCTNILRTGTSIEAQEKIAAATGANIPENETFGHQTEPDNGSVVSRRKQFWIKFKDVIIYGSFLLAVTVIAAFNSDYLLDSLDAFAEVTHIPKTFITVILIPIFSNAAEHVTSIVVAYKGHMELAMNVAVGSAIQINFFIVPFLVLIAHATKSPYTFLYENTYCETMFAASVLASFCIWNGKAYLPTGCLLIANYVLCAILIFCMV